MIVYLDYILSSSTTLTQISVKLGEIAMLLFGLGWCWSCKDWKALSVAVVYHYILLEHIRHLFSSVLFSCACDKREKSADEKRGERVRLVFAQHATISWRLFGADLGWSDWSLDIWHDATGLLAADIDIDNAEPIYVLSRAWSTQAQPE